MWYKQLPTFTSKLPPIHISSSARDKDIPDSNLLCSCTLNSVGTLQSHAIFIPESGSSLIAYDKEWWLQSCSKHLPKSECLIQLSRLLITLKQVHLSNSWYWKSLKWTQVALLSSHYLWQHKDLYFSYSLLLPSTKFKVKVVYPVNATKHTSCFWRLTADFFIFSFTLGVIVAEVVTFTGQGKSLLKLKAVLLILVPGSSTRDLHHTSSVYWCQGGNKCIHMKKLKYERERFYCAVSERCVSEEP